MEQYEFEQLEQRVASLESCLFQLLDTIYSYLDVDEPSEDARLTMLDLNKIRYELEKTNS